MKLTITDFDKFTGNHHAVDEQGHIHHVDIMVDATLGRKEYNSLDELHAFCFSLVGSQVEVDRLTPYVEIAHGVKLLKAS